MPLLSLVSGHVCGSFSPLFEFLTSNESYWDKIEKHDRILASSVDGICMLLARKKKKKKGGGERKKEKRKEEKND